MFIAQVQEKERGRHYHMYLSHPYVQGIFFMELLSKGLHFQGTLLVETFLLNCVFQWAVGTYTILKIQIVGTVS
jgi:hypothetical protein